MKNYLIFHIFSVKNLNKSYTRILTLFNIILQEILFLYVVFVHTLIVWILSFTKLKHSFFDMLGFSKNASLTTSSKIPI